jgi:hypothetical protein
VAKKRNISNEGRDANYEDNAGWNPECRSKSKDSGEDHDSRKERPNPINTKLKRAENPNGHQTKDPEDG